MWKWGEGDTKEMEIEGREREIEGERGERIEGTKLRERLRVKLMKDCG